jgi:putative ABC transport system substrate-binding protein
MNKRLLIIALIFVLALSVSACSGDEGGSGQGGDGTYTVGISQLIQHVALDAATEGFRDALTDLLGDKVTFDEQNANGEPATCAVISNQFVASGVDLIMANATPALQAAQASTNKIPILGTSVTDYGTALDIDEWAGTTGTNISGTSDLAPLDEQAAMIKEIFPDAKNIGILYCTAEPNSKYQDKVISQHLKDLGYKVKSYTFTDSNDLQTVAKAAAAESDVIYLPTDNTVASNTEIIKNVTLPAKVPVFAGEEGICAGAGVATLSISYYDLGKTTGEMAYEILVNGADPATMEIKYAPKFTKKYNVEIAGALGMTFSDEYEPL